VAEEIVLKIADKNERIFKAYQNFINEDNDTAEEEESKAAIKRFGPFNSTIESMPEAYVEI